MAVKRIIKGQLSQKDVSLLSTTRNYTWELKGKAINQGSNVKSWNLPENSSNHEVLQIDADDQVVLRVGCNDGEDFDQGILDWLGVFLDVEVNMMALEYITKGDDDGLSNISDSLEDDLT